MGSRAGGAVMNCIVDDDMVVSQAVFRVADGDKVSL
jgi:hypothetical protein